MKRLILPYLYFIVSVIITSCDPLKPGYKDCEVDGRTDYRFNLPFYYSPNTDTMQLGDTLWIESTFTNKLYNELNGKTYTLNDFKFGVIGGIDDLSTNPTIPHYGFVLVDSFRKIDSTNGNNYYIKVDYIYDGNTYYWKRGIVLNKSGAFYASFFSSLNLELLSYSGQSITKCPNEYANPIGKPMNVSNNYYLVETSPDPYIKQGKEAFRNTFIFYVKE